MSMTPSTILPGSLKSTEPIEPCDKCSKPTSKILGVVLTGGRLVCRSCSRKMFQRKS